jgi:hypothetical protein
LVLFIYTGFDFQTKTKLKTMLIVRTESQYDLLGNVIIEGGIFVVSENEWVYFIECAKTAHNKYIDELIENATVCGFADEIIINFIRITNLTAPLDYLRNTFPVEPVVEIPEIAEVPYDRAAEVAKILKQAERLDKREKKREALALKKDDSGWKVVGSKK